jgi:hypothetical protein
MARSGGRGLDFAAPAARRHAARPQPAAPLIVDWQVLVDSRTRLVSLLGGVGGHPDVRDGHLAMTSPIVAADIKELNWIRTMSRLYCLGRPTAG